MIINSKSASKVAGAACAAAGVMAFGALAVGGATAGAIAGGFILAKDAVKKLLGDEGEKETLDNDRQGDGGGAASNAAGTGSAPEESFTDNICAEPEAAGMAGTGCASGDNECQRDK